MNKLLLSIFIIITLSFTGFSQTILIDPNGDGGFENGASFAANNWSVTSGTQVNQWTLGANATSGFSGSNSAYITYTASPTVHSYTPTITSTVHFYKDITVPAGESVISLSFSWIGMGQTTLDVMRVWATSNTTINPTAGTAITSTATRTLQGNFNLQSAWTNTTITLPASLAGTTFRLIFEWKNNNSVGSNPPAGIDNISLISSCTGVTTASVSSLTNSSVNLNWNVLAGATSYSVQYKQTSSSTWIDAPSNPYSGTSAAISGLTGSTNYEYRVAATGTVCNAFSVPANFKTLCSAFTSLPYSEGFDIAGIPSCWSSGLISGTSNWNTSSNNGAVTSTHSGASFASVSGTASNALLISPPFDLNAIGSAPVQVNLWIYRSIPGTSDPLDSILVYVNTSSSLTGATEILKVFPIISKSPVVTSAGWYNYTASIPSAFNTGGPFFVIIQGSRTSSNGIGVDDFTLELGPTCLPATGSSVSNLTNTSGTISWVTPTSGTPANYIWEVRNSGAAGSGSTGVAATGTIAAPGTSVTATGLNGSTTYSLYIQTDCGLGDLSTWTNAYSFTTLPNCPSPTSASVTSVSSGSATLSWTPGGSESSWDLYYGPSPLTPPTISTIPTQSLAINSFTNTGLTPVTTYEFYVRANCGGGEVSTWTSSLIYSTPCLSSNVTSANSATLCGPGSLSLTATSDDAAATLLWYNSPSGGAAIHTGTVYTTPTLTNTTHYYVSSRGSISTYTVGKLTTAGTALPPANYLKFDAISNFTLNSVDVYAAGSGTGTIVIALQNSAGLTLQTATLTITGSASAVATTLPLNFTVTPGTNYRLNCLSVSGGITGLYRDNSGVSFPYSQLGIMSITGSSNMPSYYFFYNWQINAACESPRSMITASIMPVPTLSISAPSPVCGGSQTATLSITSSVSDFDSYIWSPVTNLYTDAAATISYTGGNANQLYSKSNVTGVTHYSVNATNSVNGCVNSSTATVTVKEAPLNPSVTISPNVICSGSAVSFSVSSVSTSTMMTAGDYIYNWTSNPTGFSASTASATSNPTTSTTYTAVITNTLTNCSVQTTTSVTVNAYPTVTVAPVSICAGESATLTASGIATNYTWSPSGINTAVAVVTPTSSTTYTLNASDNGCSVTHTVPVTVNSLPSVSATSSQSAICAGQSVTLTASGNATYYTWQPLGVNTATTVNTPTSTITYTLNSASSNGCVVTHTVAVTVNSLPFVLATSSQSAICVGEDAILTASTTATSFTWLPGSATTLSVSVSPTTTTVYTVTVSDGNNCSASSSVGLTVNLCTGIHELSAESVSIYPNPNFGNLTVTIPDNAINSTIEIYDAIGNLVIKEKLYKDSNTINTSKLDNGVYIYKISANTKSIKVGRMIKQ